MLNDTHLMVIRSNYVEDIEKQSLHGLLMTNIADGYFFYFKIPCSNKVSLLEY